MSTLQLGVFVPLTEDPRSELNKVQELGIPTCQLSFWDPDILSDELAYKVKAASEETGVTITSLWAGWPGPAVWDFYLGPVTLGLVPPAYRAERLGILKRAAHFAALIETENLTTHVGFIPENPGEQLYREVVAAVREIAICCRQYGQYFCFETGQETPIPLMRTISDVGMDNLGINLDPANLLMYGKANPVDAVEIFGSYIRGVHAKDGEYPSCGRNLGAEKPLGQGRVNFPLLVKKLKEVGYTGALTIEREITGPQQLADIQLARDLLLPLL